MQDRAVKSKQKRQNKYLKIVQRFPGPEIEPFEDIRLWYLKKGSISGPGNLRDIMYRKGGAVVAISV